MTVSLLTFQRAAERAYARRGCQGDMPGVCCPACALTDAEDALLTAYIPPAPPEAPVVDRQMRRRAERAYAQRGCRGDMPGVCCPMCALGENSDVRGAAGAGA